MNKTPELKVLSPSDIEKLLMQSNAENAVKKINAVRIEALVNSALSATMLYIFHNAEISELWKKWGIERRELFRLELRTMLEAAIKPYTEGTK